MCTISRAYSASSSANAPSANLAAPLAQPAPRCPPVDYPLRGDAHFAASGGSVWLSTFWLGASDGVGATRHPNTGKRASGFEACCLLTGEAAARKNHAQTGRR